MFKPRGSISVLVLLVIGIAFLSLAQGAQAYPTDWGVILPSHVQSQSNWCWAASDQSILGYFGVSDTQCNIVKKVFGTCPNTSATDAQAQQALSGYGLQSVRTAAALAFGTVRTEIYNSNRPVYAGWSWTGGGGHAVVIDGYSIGSTNYLDYMDPLHGSYNLVTYDWFKNGPGHVWDGTLYQIRH